MDPRLLDGLLILPFMAEMCAKHILFSRKSNPPGEGLVYIKKGGNMASQPFGKAAQDFLSRQWPKPKPSDTSSLQRVAQWNLPSIVVLVGSANSGISRR